MTETIKPTRRMIELRRIVRAIAPYKEKYSCGTTEAYKLFLKDHDYILPWGDGSGPARESSSEADYRLVPRISSDESIRVSRSLTTTIQEKSEFLGRATKMF